MNIFRSKKLFCDYILPTRKKDNSLSKEGYLVLHPVLGFIARLEKTFILNLSSIEWTDNKELGLYFKDLKEANKLARLWEGAQVVSKPSPNLPLEEMS